MAQQTANRDALIREPKTMDYPVAAGTKLFAGAMVCINSSNNAVKATDAATIKFVGVSKDLYDNTTGAAGDVRCVVHREDVVEFATAATFAVGDVAYVLDDQTVTTAGIATNDVAVGRVVRVDSGKVLVDIRERS